MNRALYTVELLRPVKVYADVNAEDDDILSVAYRNIDIWADMVITKKELCDD